MEHNGTHSITYTNTGSVPVSDVAASLIANEQLLREAAEVLQELVPGLKVEEVVVQFRSATSSSPLKELLAYSLIVVYQEDLNREVPALIEQITGRDVPDNMETLVTVLVLVVAIYGVGKAFELWKAKGAKAEGGPSPSIQGNYNQVVHVAGDLIGVDPDAITEVLGKRFTGRKARSLGRRALEFIRPAKREDGAAVEGGGVAIDPETIREAPSALDIELETDEETQDAYPAQPIIIHATDLDSAKTGWAGHLPGVWEKRLPMRLYPTIRLDDLFGKREVTGDVILVSRRDAAGEYVPYLFHVVRLD